MATPTRFEFTDKRLAALTRQGRYTDAYTPNLYLDKTNSGRLYFLLRWQDDDRKSVALRLGEFIVPVPQRGDPAYARHMTIKDARLKTGMAMARWKSDRIDPRHDTRSAKRISELTLAEDMEAYIAANWKVWKRPEDKAKHIRRTLGRHFAELLPMRTHEITEEMIDNTLLAILERAPHIERRKPKEVPMLATLYYCRDLLFSIYKTALNGKHRDRWAAGIANPLEAFSSRQRLPKLINVPHASLPNVATPGKDRPIIDFYAYLEAWRRWATEAGGKGSTNMRRARSPECIRFLLLTCAPRATEVLEAQWDQMRLDQDNPEWHVPAFNVKVRKAREGNVRVIPLSYVAVALLRAIRPADAKPTDHVFPGNKGGPMTHSTLLTFMRNHGVEEATVHGMRSTLIDFVLENRPDLIYAAQIALDHRPLGSITDTYVKTTLPIHRRILAEAWGQYLESRIEAHRTPMPERVVTRLTMHDTPPSEWPQLRLLG